MFKRLLSFAVVAIFLAGLGIRATAQDGPKADVIPPVLPDLGGRVIVAVSSNDYVPFSFVNTTNSKAVGLEYELLDEICRRLNCTLDHKQAAWDGMIAAVNRGEYELGHVGITIKDERKEQVDFSEPFVVVEQKLMVRAGEDRFKTVEEFKANKELKLGAQPGTTSFFSAFDLVGEADASTRVVPYASFALAVEAVVRGDVDGVITDAVSGAGFIGANAGKLTLLEEVIGTDPLGFIFPKGSDLVGPFNLALQSMEYDGYMSYLRNKWFFLYQPPASE
jgi:polar amino acid transport system substrate-binding protein